jgi:hypothetical protein
MNMKKYIKIIMIIMLLFCVSIQSINIFAQNLDTLPKVAKEKFKKTLWLGTNISMPILTLFSGGYGGEINGIYFISNNFGLSLGTGITNYRNTGLLTSANYSSLGQHIRAGILLGLSDFTVYHSANTNETFKMGALFGLSLVWANTHETGYWGNASYWGAGYPFDEWRQVYGVEFSTHLFFKIAKRHSFNFKPYLTICTYDNKSYFPVSSASGFGYLPFSNENSGSFTVGMQLWYYLKIN